MRKLAIAGVVGATLVLAYVRLMRPWQMRWGATSWEAERPLPGDERVPSPTWNATRAVTIEAPAAEVWRWLVQIGWGRAGWYGYDWVDNGFRESAWELLPEHQEMFVGKEFPMSPVTAMRCVEFEAGRWMLWQNNVRAGTWLWYLDDIEGTRTRLITRMRDRYDWRQPWRLPMQLAVDVLDWPFMRACMLGIKARAERARSTAAAGNPGQLGGIGSPPV